MPKMKTRRCAAKRFSTTGTGKFKRRRQNLRHILTKKDAKRKMRLGQGALVDATNVKAVRRMMLRLSVADCIPFSALGWHDLRLAGFPISIGG